jgi:hypothetical protein
MGPKDVAVGEMALVDGEPVVVGLDQDALAPPIAVDPGMGLDRHHLADEALEVVRGAQRALQPRARHFEEVPTARNGVLMVEGGADALGRPGQRIEVNTTGTIGQHDEAATAELDVEQLEPFLGQEGLDELSYPVDYAHRTLLSTHKSVGDSPRQLHDCTSVPARRV